MFVGGRRWGGDPLAGGGDVRRVGLRLTPLSCGCSGSCAGPGRPVLLDPPRGARPSSRRETVFCTGQAFPSGGVRGICRGGHAVGTPRRRGSLLFTAGHQTGKERGHAGYRPPTGRWYLTGGCGCLAGGCGFSAGRCRCRVAGGRGGAGGCRRSAGCGRWAVCRGRRAVSSSRCSSCAGAPPPRFVQAEVSAAGRVGRVRGGGGAGALAVARAARGGGAGAVDGPDRLRRPC